MDFEYDEAKREQNFKDHGVDLLYGALIFDGVTVEALDLRHDYSEQRIIAVGMVEGECFVTVYTRREDRVRLISTRKGGRRDRRKYEEAISGRDPGVEGGGRNPP